MVLDAFDQLAQCRHFSFHVTRFVLTISYCQFHFCFKNKADCRFTVRVSFEAESANTRPLSSSNYCAATGDCIMPGSWTWAYSDNDAWRYDDDRMQYTSTYQSWCSIILPRSVSHSLHVHSLRRLWCDLFVRHWTHSLCAVDTTLFS